jgi:hypothetical protein
MRQRPLNQQRRKRRMGLLHGRRHHHQPGRHTPSRKIRKSIIGAQVTRCGASTVQISANYSQKANNQSPTIPYQVAATAAPSLPHQIQFHQHQQCRLTPYFRRSSAVQDVSSHDDHARRLASASCSVNIIQQTARWPRKYSAITLIT